MTADPARVATAHLLLTQLGVTLADLHDSSMRQRPAPTIAEYLPRVVAAASPSANRLYGTYWNRMVVAWGDRPLDTIAASDVEAPATRSRRHRPPPTKQPRWSPSWRTHPFRRPGCVQSGHRRRAS